MADLWALFLAAALSWPLLHSSGYGLARDMVFTPHQPLDLDALGLGPAAPRAVPVNAVLGLSALVLDGTWVGRLAVLAVLALAGCGAHRLVPSWSLAARLFVAGFAVWNPFVIERLTLGQWALLACYAALPWLVRAARDYRDDRGAPVASRALAPLIGWLALASLTPTGGLIGAVTAVVIGVGSDRRRTLVLATAGVVLQLPWLLPALLNGASATSDPAGVAAFAARPERAGGAVLSLLGLGGIWDAGSAPPSRSGPLGYLTTALVVVVLILGVRGLAGAVGPATRNRLVALAAAGFVLAAASNVAGLRAVLRWAVATLPGAGLLRDSQKWLLPFVLLVVLAGGWCAEQLCRAARRSVAVTAMIVVGCAAVPLLLLPDALATTRTTLTPVRYPADFEAVAERVNGHGPVLTVPLSAYRRFSWGAPVAVADPAPQWFDTLVLGSDELVVGGTRITGENRVTAEVARALAAGRPAETVLAGQGIRWALVYRDAAGATSLHLDGLRRVYSGRYLELYRVDSPLRGGAMHPGTAVLATVTAVDCLVLGLVLGALLGYPIRRVTSTSTARLFAKLR